MKKISKNYNSLLIEQLRTKPIAFNPLLAQLAHSALAGLFLSQLLFWHEKGAKKGWVWKTIKNVWAETSMTRSEQDRSIRIWKRLGVLEVELHGIPRRRYFKINIEKLVALLEKNFNKRVLLPTNQIADFDKQEYPNGLTITESTREKTFRDFSLQETRDAKSRYGEMRKRFGKAFPGGSDD